MIGTFKVNHPAAMSMADVGMLIGGKVGREVFGGAYCIRSFKLFSPLVSGR